MRRMILAALAAFVIGPASAADMSVPFTKAAPLMPVTSWSGIGLGVHGGYGWNVTGVQVDLAGTPIDLGSVPHGIMGGGQFFARKQINEYIVLGVSSDLDVANFRSSGAVGNGLLTANNLSNYFVTANATFGVTIGNHSLLFAEGGLACGGNKPNFQVASLQAAASDTSCGWNAGGGIETKLPAFPGWSAVLKGGFMDLGKKSLSIDTGGGVLATSTNPIQAGYAKIGLNYNLYGN